MSSWGFPDVASPPSNPEVASLAELMSWVSEASQEEVARALATVASPDQPTPSSSWVEVAPPQPSPFPTTALPPVAALSPASQGVFDALLAPYSPPALARPLAQEGVPVNTTQIAPFNFFVAPQNNLNPHYIGDPTYSRDLPTMSWDGQWQLWNANGGMAGPNRFDAQVGNAFLPFAMPVASSGLLIRFRDLDGSWMPVTMPTGPIDFNSLTLANESVNRRLHIIGKELGPTPAVRDIQWAATRVVQALQQEAVIRGVALASLTAYTPGSPLFGVEMGLTIEGVVDFWRTLIRPRYMCEQVIRDEYSDVPLKRDYMLAVLDCVVLARAMSSGPINRTPVISIAKGLHGINQDAVAPLVDEVREVALMNGAFFVAKEQRCE